MALENKVKSLQEELDECYVAQLLECSNGDCKVANDVKTTQEEYLRSDQSDDNFRRTGEDACTIDAELDSLEREDVSSNSSGSADDIENDILGNRDLAAMLSQNLKEKTARQKAEFDHAEGHDRSVIGTKTVCGVDTKSQVNVTEKVMVNYRGRRRSSVTRISPRLLATRRVPGNTVCDPPLYTQSKDLI